MHLILASESPRRKKILEDAGFSFTIFPPQVSEYLEENLNVRSQIERIAERKAKDVLKRFNPLKSQDYLILAADTMVVFNNQALGKPKTLDQGRQYLEWLSQNTHQVITSLCLITAHSQDSCLKMGNQLLRSEVTQVTFRKLTNEEIDSYLSTGEPLDKAGAYGIQGHASKFVEKIDGPLDNVIGLPMGLCRSMMFELGIDQEVLK